MSRPALSTTGQQTPTSPLAARHVVVRTKVPTVRFDASEDTGRYVAQVIAEIIRRHSEQGRRTVLGLATGSTPIGVYRELIRLHREEELDFAHVVTFNLDEYWPMPPDSLHSYQRWMRENFFDHVNVPDEQIHIPRGDLRRDQVDEFCREYEAQIEAAGGIDVQLLGVGRTGHIGFNEPGSSRDSCTRLITLDPVTRKDAGSGFYGEENVPLRAITMGVGTILAARRVICMALGEHKAAVMRQAAEGSQTGQIVASFLQSHENAEFVLDAAAAADLTAVRTPWQVETVDWTPPLERRAVIWLSEQTGQPILKLEAKDFHEHHLADLVYESGPVEHIRQRVFDRLMATLCSEPGGTRKQTVLVFSPHPDDDVISMGGTFVTLAEQGHDVHVAYMTSGNIAVFDHDALRHIDYVGEFLDLFGLESSDSAAIEAHLRNAIVMRKPGDVDAPDVLKVKALIRQTEALQAARTAGVPAERCHFLNLPFYRTGEVRKNPIGPDDVAIIVRLLTDLDPGQIYVAGDLSDPHGTHRMCAQAILAALDETIRIEDGSDIQNAHFAPEVWLYRGAWQEYEPHEIDRAVPLSPEVLLKKKLAIFKHESQKDAALFPGHDEREFWVRADERTKETARRYNALGLPEFYALESFKRYDGGL